MHADTGTLAYIAREGLEPGVTTNAGAAWSEPPLPGGGGRAQAGSHGTAAASRLAAVSRRLTLDGPCTPGGCLDTDAER